MVRKQSNRDERGQAFIFDATVAGFLLLGAVTVAILATGLSLQDVSQPESEILQGEYESEVEMALTASERDGTLKETMLAWDDDAEQFNDGSTTSAPAGQGWFVGYPDNAFGDRLEDIEATHGVKINVYMIPASDAEGDGTANRTQLIDTTAGGGDRSVVRHKISLDEADTLGSSASTHNVRSGVSTEGATEESDSSRLENAETYPIPPGEGAMSGERVYNVVTVEAVIYDD